MGVFFFLCFSFLGWSCLFIWFVVAAAGDSFKAFNEFKKLYKPHLSLPLPISHPCCSYSSWVSDLQSSGRTPPKWGMEEEGEAIAWILATPGRGLCYNQRFSRLGVAESLPSMAGFHGPIHTLEQLYLLPYCRNPPPLLLHGRHRRRWHRPDWLRCRKRPIHLLGHSSNRIRGQGYREIAWTRSQVPRSESTHLLASRHRVHVDVCV